MNEGRQMTSRIPVTPETHKRIQKFAQALDTTYDEALNFVFDRILEGKSSLAGGEELQPEFAAWLKKKEKESKR